MLELWGWKILGGGGKWLHELFIGFLPIKRAVIRLWGVRCGEFPCRDRGNDFDELRELRCRYIFRSRG